MVQINLYKPGKINCNINFPSEWNELLPEELLIICKKQLSEFKNVYDQIAAIFNDIFLLRCKPFKKQLPQNFHLQIDEEDAATNALPLINFLYKQNRLTKQLFPVIKIPLPFHYRIFKFSNCLIAHGPESDFNNLTCGEFEDAEIFFQQFIQNPAQEPLAHLAAILWRPRASLFTGRKPYMKFSTKENQCKVYDHEKYYDSFLKLPQYRLYALFVWYAGCRSMLPLIFPTLYKKSNAQVSDTTEPDLLSFTKCIHSAAGAKNGSREDIRRTLLKEFFMELELEAIHQQKMLENAKR
jgi:hypothetical protein